MQILQEAQFLRRKYVCCASLFLDLFIERLLLIDDIHSVELLCRLISGGLSALQRCLNGLTFSLTLV